MSPSLTESNFTLKVFPIEKEFIGSIEFKSSPEIIKPRAKVPTILMLDRSGSMGSSLNKITRSILPQFFENLSYDEDADIHVIAFESCTKLLVKKVKEFNDIQIRSVGGTSMIQALKKLKRLFKQFDENSIAAVRILTISDGNVGDQKQTKDLCDELAEYASKLNILVNSQVVRFLLTPNELDITALCSLLQLNNVVKSKITDVGIKNDIKIVAKEISNLFIDDGFESLKTLQCNSAIFYKFPWDESADDKVILMTNRHNVFWLNEMPKDSTSLSIDGESVKIDTAEALTFDMFQQFINAKLDFIIDRMKILKINNSQSAKDTIEKIVDYFTRLENIMDSLTDDEPHDNKSIANRARAVKLNAIRTHKITAFLSTIAMDENVEQLNAAQKAQYLRSVQASSKAGRGLAKRASKGKKATRGKKQAITVFSFDEIVRNEVLRMKKHFHKIKDINCKNHTISFYSHATTLEGIESLIDFTDDPQFNNFDANELLQIINIVGVACKGPIGDFPDASSWNVNEIYVGCYVSVADIITAIQQSGENNYKLVVPGSEKEITNVIPVFDDPRIGAFLKKYAPCILEYSSSIGIRRIIADVPMTFGYTVIAGIRRLMYIMNKEKTTAHVETFKSFVTTAASFVGKYYDHIDELIVDDDFGNFSYYLANNGIANLMVPLIRIFKNQKSVKIADILRSIYSCEVWRGVSKEFKGNSRFEKTVKEMMDRLLSIDYDKNKIQVQQPFTAEPEKSSIVFYDNFTVNEEYLEELSSPLYYHNYMTLLPEFLDAAINGPIDKIKDIKKMKKESILKAFDIDYPYIDFIFFNIYQALRYPRSTARADIESKQMKVIDVKHKDLVIEDIKSYVRKQFEDLYDYEVKMKIHKEKSELASQFVTSIINQNNFNDVLSTWKNGIIYNGILFKFTNSSSIAFKILSQMLLDVHISIPLRAEIIKILILARDSDDNVVYNKGQIADIKNVKKFKKRFLITKTIDEWNEIEEKLKSRSSHKYRPMRNRHGHGTDKPSYYAMGYTYINDYFEALDEDENAMSEYKKKHEKCCNASNVYDAFYQKLKMEKLRRIEESKKRRAESKN